MELEHKDVPVSGFKVLDEDNGVVEAVVSVTGVVDRVRDRIHPGAYAKSLAARTPKGVWGHDWGTPVAKALEVQELPPGDSRLPEQLQSSGGGGLWVKAQFNLQTQRGREAYEDVRFFGDDQEWSIGYKVPKGGAKVDGQGIRHIKELDVFEFSPVLFGAAPMARSLAMKDLLQAAAEEGVVDEKVLDALDRFVAEQRGLDPAPPCGCSEEKGEPASTSGVAQRRQTEPIVERAETQSDHRHVDADEDGDCDVCGAEMEDDDEDETKVAVEAKERTGLSDEDYERWLDKIRGANSTDDADTAWEALAGEASREQLESAGQEFDRLYRRLLDREKKQAEQAEDEGQPVEDIEAADVEVAETTPAEVEVEATPAGAEVEATEEKHGNLDDPGYRALHPNSRLNKGKGKAKTGGSGGGKAKASAPAKGKTSDGEKSKSKGGKYRPKNVEDAVKALAEGKEIEFEQPREVSTLLARLAEIADEAKAKGDKAPDFNLCLVSVPGTNLFCAENKGYTRLTMPQLSGPPKPGSRADKLEKNEKGEVDITNQFREHLRSKGIGLKKETEKASYLRATQREMKGGQVGGMMRAIEKGERPGASDKEKAISESLRGGRIFISREGYVVDGHHRWAALVGLDAADNDLDEVSMNVERIDMPILEVLAETLAFTDDWGIKPKGLQGAKWIVDQLDLDMETKDRLMEVLDRMETKDRPDAGAGEFRARHLIRWFEKGEGALRIRWGTPGDFNRCVRIASKHMRPDQAKGFCNLRHKGALGIYPAQHKAEDDQLDFKAISDNLAAWADAYVTEAKWDDNEGWDESDILAPEEKAADMTFYNDRDTAGNYGNASAFSPSDHTHGTVVTIDSPTGRVVVNGVPVTSTSSQVTVNGQLVDDEKAHAAKPHPFAGKRGETCKVCKHDFEGGAHFGSEKPRSEEDDDDDEEKTLLDSVDLMELESLRLAVEL